MGIGPRVEERGFGKDEEMKKVLGLIVILIAAVVIGGFLISGEYDVQRSVTIEAKSDEVFPYLNNLKKWQEWSAWTTEKYPKMKTTYSGPEEGVGARSEWVDEDNGNGNLEILESSPESGIVYQLNFEGFPSSQGWIEIASSEAGTKVTMRNKGSMGNNLMFRYMSLFMDKMMGSEFEQGLTKLKGILESSQAS